MTCIPCDCVISFFNVSLESCYFLDEFVVCLISRELWFAYRSSHIKHECTEDTGVNWASVSYASVLRQPQWTWIRQIDRGDITEGLGNSRGNANSYFHPLPGYTLS